MDGPSVGQAVTLEVMDELGARQVFAGLVFEAEEGEGPVLQVDDPSDPDLLTPGTAVLVRWADGSGLHYFRSTFEEAHAGPRTRIRVAAPRRVEHQQRRRFLRLPMRIPVVLTRLDAQGHPKQECLANTLEVGGNGAGLICERSFAAGERLRFSFDLPDFGTCSGLAEVKRSVLTPSAGAPVHRVALHFVEVDSRTQALIFSFLLATRRGRGP